MKIKLDNLAFIKENECIDVNNNLVENVLTQSNSKGGLKGEDETGLLNFQLMKCVMDNKIMKYQKNIRKIGD